MATGEKIGYGARMGTGIVILLSTFLKGLLMEAWDRYKERKSREPIPLKLRRGIYVPWGVVQKVQHYGWRVTQVWLVYLAIAFTWIAVGPLFNPA
jgi:hypothetical protein